MTHYKISNIDLTNLLTMFNFEGINIVKLVSVGLVDDQVNVLLNFICNKPIDSLVLTGNKLTEGCLPMFLNGKLNYLKELYLGNNRINKVVAKENIS